ncbi:MAG: hypothetical protein M3126_08195 [Candidatus Eremiobacteraeota bacterium]|nr:hypothetical protein [Candidatus Eremiobacteraeota bacterium]
MLLALCYGAVERRPLRAAGTFSITNPAGPYISGGPIAIQTSGIHGRLALSLIGPGDLEGNLYNTPALAHAQNATIVAATPFAYALAELHLVPPPHAGEKIIAVAGYGSGIALHSEKNFALIGIIASAEPVGDVAVGADGALYAPLTDTTTMMVVTRAPWSVGQIGNVPSGNEVAIDRSDGAIFISNRDVAGKGALTRILHGITDRVVTGITAEGLALDEAGHHIFVGNVNDESVLEVDTRTMGTVRRLQSVPRTFGIALDERARNLFVVSNQNERMRHGGGYVARIDLAPARGRIAARSKNLPFPLGIAYDAKTRHVFTTDEDLGSVYVFNADTLLEAHRALSACNLPWRPHIDERLRRLYVPCAKANAVAVFNLDTLRELPGSPFATGTYPLGVATSN